MNEPIAARSSIRSSPEGDRSLIVNQSEQTRYDFGSLALAILEFRSHRGSMELRTVVCAASERPMSVATGTTVHDDPMTDTTPNAGSNGRADSNVHAV
jgi:hypothetical protein